MSADQPWTDIAAAKTCSFAARASRNLSRYMLFSLSQLWLRLLVPCCWPFLGIGMSEQEAGVASNGAFASLVAICAGFLIIRRLIEVATVASI